jgi:F420-dependent oxidoreductase-like protein
MEIGLMVEGQEDVTWPDWLEVAGASEVHGFDALFLSDHYLSKTQPSGRGGLDAWMTMAGLALRTSRVRLGVLVSPVTFRHPSVLAKSVVTVDHLSCGRVELGIGAGWLEAEHRAFGFPFPPRGARSEMLAEQVEMVHRLWDRNEPEVRFEGKHYRLDGASALPKPVQDPHPPLILGGAGGPRSAALAARWADEYNVNLVGPSTVAERRRGLVAACERAGRDPATLRYSVMSIVLAGEDRAALVRNARRILELRGEEGDPDAFLADVRDRWFVGTAPQIRDRVAEYAEAAVGRVIMKHVVHSDLDTIGLLGRDVVPYARGLGPSG